MQRTLKNLGLVEALKIGVSYGQAQSTPQIAGSHLGGFPHQPLRQTGSTGRFSRTTPRKSGAFPAGRFRRNGARSASKACRSRKRIAHALGEAFRNSARRRSKADRNQPDRTISVSQIWTRPNVGGSCASGRWRGGQIHLRHRIVGIERDGTQVTAVNVLRREHAVQSAAFLAIISFRRCRSTISSRSCEPEDSTCAARSPTTFPIATS